MQARTLFALVVGASLTVACSGLTAEQRAAALRVDILTIDPASNCQNLGSLPGVPDDVNRVRIREQAVLLGGNAVRAKGDGTTTVLYCPRPKADGGEP